MTNAERLAQLEREVDALKDRSDELESAVRFVATVLAFSSVGMGTVARLAMRGLAKGFPLKLNLPVG